MTVSRDRPAIVSIQSQLVFGCAGNNAAVPLLQRLGASVYAIPTALLSNTPHYPSIAGGPVDPALIESLLERLLDRIEPGEIDAILTGYIGSAAAAQAAARFIDRVRERHPGVVVLCDPVMGDIDTGLYVDDDVANALAETLVPRADILTPNLFEARRLTGKPEGDTVTILDALLGQHASVAAVTGIDAGDGRMRTIAGDRDGGWNVATPHLDLHPTGTGDIFSAAFLHAFLRTGATARAMETAVEAAFSLLDSCHAAGAAELDPGSFTPGDDASPMFPAQQTQP